MDQSAELYAGQMSVEELGAALAFYETGDDTYVTLDKEELDAVALESTHTIDIHKFVPAGEIDDLYVDAPYYIVPDGDVGQQAFAVIRDAIRKQGMVALGKVVFTTREHIIALEARDQGMVGVTLRYPYEVRQAQDYFDVIEDEKVPKDMLDLAVHIVDSKKGRFEPEKFEDEYESALKELLRKKQKGERIERPKEPARTNVVNLMDALRRSVGQEKRTPASAKKGRKRVAGQTEMLLPIAGKKGKEAAVKPLAKPTARQKKAG